MYELIVERSFSSAHCLRDYDGACARLHGHNYRVECSVVGEQLQPDGMLLDFGRLKELCDEILDAMDHRLLNELPQFADVNPTSEGIARYIFEALEASLGMGNVRVSAVRVWETPGQSATYRRYAR
jgi:6-pyruvoyltetrahydropterin/6-carboxytetrahydropterin synthase